MCKSNMLVYRIIIIENLNLWIWNLSYNSSAVVCTLETSRFSFRTHLTHTLIIYFQYSYYILNESSYVVHDQKSNKNTYDAKLTIRLSNLLTEEMTQLNTNKKKGSFTKKFLHKMYNMSTLFLQVSKMDRAIWGGKMFRVTRLDWFLFCLLKKKWANKTFMSIVIAHAQIANGNTSWKYGKK